MDNLHLDQWICRKTGGAFPLERNLLETFQLAQLRATLSLVKEKSRFYGERLAAVNVETFSSLKDIEELPFTTQEDLRQEGERMVCVPQTEIHRIVTLTTSGTTGPSKRVYFTKEDQELTVDFFDHGMRVLVGPGDRVLILLPGQRPGSVGALLATGLERLGATASVADIIRPGEAAWAASVAMALAEEKATAVVGGPAETLEVARAWEKLSPDSRAQSAIHSVLLSTDYIPEDCCRELEHIWNCRVFEHYGMTEMGLGGAVACGFGRGYHPREADLYFEIIDPQTGRVLPEGEFGEVVFTTLTRRGMPLIRYRTGDRSRWLTDPCPCGSRLKRLDKVGRRGEINE